MSGTPSRADYLQALSNRARLLEGGASQLRPNGSSAPDEHTAAPFNARTGAFTTFRLCDLLSDPDMTAPMPYLVPGLIPAGATVLLYGSPKVGKTTFAAHLCAALARGGEFLGRPIQAVPVLYCDLERHRRMMAYRLREPFGDELPPPDFHVCNLKPSPQELQAAIREHSVRFVVLDTLLRLTELSDENSASEVRLKLSPWVDLAHAEDVTLVFIHHDRKGGGEHGTGARGSNNIVGMVDVALHLVRESGEEAAAHRRLNAVSNYDGVEPLLYLERFDGQFRATMTPSQERQERVWRTLEAEGRALTVPDLAQRLGEPRTTVDLAVEGLLSAGRASRDGKGRRRSPYTYRAVSSNTMESKGLEETSTAPDGSGDAWEPPVQSDGTGRLLG